MYRVSAVPRPALGRFLAQCVWFGASRGARYGLICGSLYGSIYFFFGGLFGGAAGLLFGFVVGIFAIPLGLAFGTAVGILDGFICGLVLYHKSTISIDRADIFCGWIGIFSFLACVIGGYVLGGADRLLGGSHRSGIDFFDADNVVVVIIPALIAGICGYRASGDLLRWYSRVWFEPESAALKHARKRID